MVCCYHLLTSLSQGVGSHFKLHLKFRYRSSSSARTFTWSYDMVIPLALALLPFLLFSAVIGIFVFCCSRWRVRGSQDLSDSSFWSEFSMPVSWILFLNLESKNHNNSRSDMLRIYIFIVGMYNPKPNHDKVQFSVE